MKTIHRCIEGALPSTEGTLYTVPVGCRATWRSASLVNTDSTARMSYLLVNGTHVLRVNLAAGDSVYLDELPLLDAGGIVSGYAAAAGVVEYILGVKEEHDV